MLTYSFHFSQFISLAQFIPEIYNKIIIKILGYFWGITVKMNGVRLDVIKLQLFPFSLGDIASTWFESLLV